MELGNSRRLILVALFAALAVVLNPVTVPAPYAGFLLYGVWEIPIVLALLLLGFWGASTVAVINGIALEFINPGGLPTGPLYNLFAELSMFLGVMAAQAVVRRRNWGAAVTAGIATALGAGTRVGVMTVVNDLVLAQPYPVGFGTFGVTQAAVPGLLVLIGVFNLTVALYTIPAAYSIRRAVASRYPDLGRKPAQTFTP